MAACTLARPSDGARKVARASPDNYQLWQVPPSRTGDNNSQIAWPNLQTTEVQINKASDDGNLISFYPTAGNAGGQAYVLFSSAQKDLDGMGQDVRISYYMSNGSWSRPEIAFPPALRDNETATIETAEYYCNNSIPQRALQPVGIFYAGGDESSPRWYAVAQSSDNTCPGSFQSAGRIARRINQGAASLDLFLEDPCWIETNEYTESHGWKDTIYGTKYNMKVCDDKDLINAALGRPADVPPLWPSLLDKPLTVPYNHNISYPTWSYYLGESSTYGRWMRFWIDTSVRNNSGFASVEFTDDIDGKNWFPYTNNTSNITVTNIPTTSKSWFGGADYMGLRILISNTNGLNASESKLTIATSRGTDLSFRNIGILTGRDPSNQTPVSSRSDTAYSLPGFYWPSAAFSGDELIIAYTENRGAIFVSTIKFSDLP